MGAACAFLSSSHVAVAVPSCVPLRALVGLAVVMRRHDLFAELLLSLMYVGVQLVSVLPDRELRVVVDRDVDPPVADWFVVRVVELGDIRVPQGLLGGQALGGIELEEVTDQVDSLIRGAWEHVTDSLLLGWGQRLEHR